MSVHYNLTDEDLHVPGYITGTDPATTYGTADTLSAPGVRAGQLWIEESSADVANALKYRNAANGAWNTIIPALTQGDLLHADADPDLATLAIGPARQLLQVNSGATAPEWTSTIVLSSTTETLVDLTSTIDQASVEILRLTGNRANPANGDEIHISYELADNNSVVEIARLTASIEDVTGGQADGALLFEVNRNGTLEVAAKLNTTEIVFNESGADRDFRVEGSGQANALVVQGSDGFVGIGVAAPTVALDVAGALNTTGNVDLGGTLDVTGAVTLDSTLKALGAAAFGSVGVLGNADATFANVFGIDGGNAEFFSTGNMSWTLDADDNATGLLFRWFNNGTFGGLGGTQTELMRLHESDGLNVSLAIESTGAATLDTGANGSSFGGALDVAGEITSTAGVLALAETTTPTAVAGEGRVYTKTDNKLYFQDGAGTEHELATV